MRLNNMLSQPDILKKMNSDGTDVKHSKYKIILFIHNSFTCLVDDENNTKQKMKISFNYQDLNNNESSNEKKVKILVDDFEKKEKSENVNLAIMEDIKKQGDSFKERLQKRKSRMQEKSKANSKVNSRAASPKSSKIDEEEHGEVLKKALNFNLKNSDFAENEDKETNTHGILFNEEKGKSRKETEEKVEIIDKIEGVEKQDEINEEEENVSKI